MTGTITPIEILKSRQNFSDYIEKNADSVIQNLLKDYPPRPLQIIYPQLTQSTDGLMEIVSQLESNQKAYIFWFIVNEKEDLKNRAPTDAWREWLDWRSEGARIARIDHKERGIPFDYHRYLYDFKVNYIIDYLQDKKITK